MFLVSNFLQAIAELLDIGLNLYMWAIIVQALLSWVSPDPYNPIVRFLYQITEPVLRYIRKILPLGGYGIDFSPMIAILIIIFLRRAIVRSLLELALSLG